MQVADEPEAAHNYSVQRPQDGRSCSAHAKVRPVARAQLQTANEQAAGTRTFEMEARGPGVLNWSPSEDERQRSQLIYGNSHKIVE